MEWEFEDQLWGKQKPIYSKRARANTELETEISITLDEGPIYQVWECMML